MKKFSGQLPEGFPVAIVEHDEGGRILKCNNCFTELFFASQDNDEFRRETKPEDVLPLLHGNGHDVPDDRNAYIKEFGRSDYFTVWDGDDDDYKVLAFPRLPKNMDDLDEEEIKRLKGARYENDRYFRFWTEETGRVTRGKKKIYFTCIVDVTPDRRRAVEDLRAERAFARTLSKQLIHDDLRNHDIFALESLPINGRERAGGDFFFFWRVGKPRKKRATPLVVVMIGDAADRNLRAAAAVQHAASILLPYCRSSNLRSQKKKDNPAKLLIERLNRSVIATQVFPNNGIDGILMVIDFDDETIYHADGKLGAFLYQTNKHKMSEIGSSIDRARSAGNGKSIGVDDDASFSSSHTKFKSDTLLFAMTDGIRNRYYDREDKKDDTSKRVRSVVKNALDKTEKKHQEAASKTERVPFAQLQLKAVTAALAHPGLGKQSDDELTVTISLDALKRFVMK